MKVHDIEKKIRSMPYSVFTFSDIRRVVPEKKTNLYTYLSRMKKAGLIYEVEKGKYTLATDPFEVATGLVQPSYISFLSGLNLRGISDQIPVRLQVICTRQKKEIMFAGMKIQFIRFHKKRIFGFEKIKHGRSEIFVADPEKLILDSLYMPEHAPVAEVFKAMQEGFDEAKLLKYAKLMDSKIVSKRLGYLLELLGSDHSQELRISNKYELLNPSKNKKGSINKKWKLIVNEVIEDAYER